MSEKGFDYSARRYIPIDEETRKLLAINVGDFFVSRGNGSLNLVGKGTLANEPPESIVFPDTMIRYRIDAADVNREWIAFVWGSLFVRGNLEPKAKTTAGIYKISQEDISRIPIPIPPLDEQIALACIIEEQLDEAVRLESQTLSAANRGRALRQSVLKIAFTGQLVAQDPNDEPASELLKRIAEERAVSVTKKASPRKPATKRKKREK